MLKRTTQTTRWILGLALIGALTVGLGGLAERPAHAACNEEQNADTDGKKKNYRTVVGPDGRKVFVIEKAFVVCGKVPKPTVIYALQASSINYEWETLTQDFLPKVIEATRKAPF
ncbi:MAG TPA: hypothetical protein VKZ63_10720 [Kofleriaceae bacterium]|nr:hypothetical protein [Kofleriaceae bacterium]